MYINTCINTCKKNEKLKNKDHSLISANANSVVKQHLYIPGISPKCEPR